MALTAEHDPEITMIELCTISAAHRTSDTTLGGGNTTVLNPLYLNCFLTAYFCQP